MEWAVEEDGKVSPIALFLVHQQLFLLCLNTQLLGRISAGGGLGGA